MLRPTTTLAAARAIHSITGITDVDHLDAIERLIRESVYGGVLGGLSAEDFRALVLRAAKHMGYLPPQVLVD